MKKKNELNPLQKLFVRKPDVSTQKLRKFYEKMMKDPKVPERFKEKGMTPERMASDYLKMHILGYDTEYRCDLPALVHEFEENGSTYNLYVHQGWLSDYEIGYPATRFVLEKDGDLIKDTTVGASLLSSVDITEVLEYARITYGEDTYAYLMELAAKKVEVLVDADFDASSDALHRKNQRKLELFMKLDKTARQVYKEVKALNKECEVYQNTRQESDRKNDMRKKQFNEKIVVFPENIRMVETTGKGKKIEDREKED